MQINLVIPDNIRRIIEPQIGQTVEQMATEIIRTRINNLFKKFAPRRPVGRPKVSEARKQESALAKDLQAIFDNLRHVFPDEYEDLYGAMETKLRAAISRGDMEILEWFDKNKPWLTGGDAE